MAPVRPPGMPKTNSMPACSSTRTIASGTETCESRSRVAMSQPFFEEVERDSMLSKNSCAEHTTRRQLQQQVCTTHQGSTKGLLPHTGPCTLTPRDPGLGTARRTVWWQK